MRRIHSISVVEYHNRNLARVCRRTKDKSSLVPCEMCGATTSLKDCVRHMGRHMEDIALFALGTWEQDENEHDSEVSDEEEEDNEDEDVGENESQSRDDGVNTNTAASEASEGGGQTNESTNETNEPRGRRRGLNEYFIDEQGISRAVIEADICRYLGNDTLVRPGIYEVSILPFVCHTSPFKFRQKSDPQAGQTRILPYSI